MQCPAKSAGQVVKLLVHAGADTSFYNSYTGVHGHLLHLAAACGDMRTPKRLFAAGCDSNITDSDGNTPLSLAVSNCEVSAAAALLKAGANAQFMPGTVGVALCHAALAECTPMLRLLASAGANMAAALHAAAAYLAEASAAAAAEAGASAAVAPDRPGSSVVTRAAARVHRAAFKQAPAAAACTGNIQGAPAAAGGCTGLVRSMEAAEHSSARAVEGRQAAQLLPPSAQTAHTGQQQVACPAAGETHAAAAVAATAGLKLLVNVAGSPNVRGASNETALHVAAGCDRQDIVAVLVQHGASPSVISGGATPIGAAAAGKHAAVIEQMLAAGTHPTPVDIMFAAEQGLERVVVRLLAAGACVAVCWNDGSDVLHCAARGGITGPTIQQLTTAGADIHFKDKRGATPLHLAVGCSNLDMIPMLLAAGADPMATTPHGHTPLHFGVMGGVPESYLAQLRAQAEARDPDFAARLAEAEATLIRMQQSGGRSEAEHAAACLQAIKLLLDAGANPNAALSTCGTTPFHFALGSGQVGAVELLLGAGADPQRSMHNLALLEVAVRLGQAEMVRLLLAAGANPNIPVLPNSEIFLLATAAPKGDLEVVRALLDGGARSSTVDGLRHDALQGAIQSNHLEVVKLLLRHDRCKHPPSAESVTEGLRCALLFPQEPSYNIAAQIQLKMYCLAKEGGQLGGRQQPYKAIDDILQDPDTARDIERSANSLALLCGWAAETADADAAQAALVVQEQEAAAVAAGARELLVLTAAAAAAAASRGASGGRVRTAAAAAAAGPPHRSGASVIGGLCLLPPAAAAAAAATTQSKTSGRSKPGKTAPAAAAAANARHAVPAAAAAAAPRRSLRARRGTGAT